MNDSLHGDRVYLRAIEADDTDAFHELFNDPETHLLASYDPFVPQSAARIRAGIEKAYGEPPERWSDTFLTAVARDGDTVIGLAGLHGFVGLSRVARLGVTLRAQARGQGYGRELVVLLCRYGFRMRGLRRLELETVASNLAMRRAAERVGFVHEGTQRERSYDGENYSDIVCYGLLRSEWHDTP